MDHNPYVSPIVRQHLAYNTMPPVESIRFGYMERGRKKYAPIRVYAKDFPTYKDYMLGVAGCLIDAQHFTRIVVRFEADCHDYIAVIEKILEKTMLTVPGVGVVASHTAII